MQAAQKRFDAAVALSSVKQQTAKRQHTRSYETHLHDLN
jgi:hypothetical protein